MKTKVEIDFYEGAYGPTLRIHVLSEHELKKVQNIFGELAKGNIEKYRLRESSLFNLNGFYDLILFVVGQNNCSEKTVEISKSEKSHDNIIEWRNSPEGWDECHDLIDGILSTAEPCHQYLSIEGIDDVIILVSYME